MMNKAIQEFCDASVKGSWVISLTNSAHPPDPELVEILKKCKAKVTSFVGVAETLDGSVINKLKALLESKDSAKPGLLILDDFTFNLSKELISLLSYTRHMTVSTLLVLHSVKGGPVFTRLRESMTTLTCFPLTDPRALEDVIGANFFFEYMRDVKGELRNKLTLISVMTLPRYSQKTNGQISTTLTISRLR